MNKKTCILSLIISLSITSTSFANNKIAATDAGNIIGGLINIFSDHPHNNTAPPKASSNTNTPYSDMFMAAVSAGDYELTQQMLDQKVDINGVYNENTAFMVALRARNRDMMQFLLDRGANVNGFYIQKKKHFSYVVEAAYMNDLDTIKYLIAWGADINGITKKANGDDNALNTVLSDSTQSFNFDIISYLIDNGINVNHPGDLYGTPLTAVCMRSQTELSTNVFYALLNAGANVNKPDRFGHTPLFYATEKKNMSFIKELLSRGAK